jgi:hypothetical protein
LSWRTSTAWRTGHDGPAVRVLTEAADAALRTRQGDIAAAERSPGLSGIAVMRDTVRLSLRDLATLVVAVSDNAAVLPAADAVIGTAARIAVDALRAL